MRRTGLVLGLSGYLVWGGMPLAFNAARPAGAVEILAHRIVWSFVFCLVLLAVARAYPSFGKVLRDGRTMGVLALASVFIAINWLAYVFGVEIGRVVELSLGYFINPLVTVLMGVVFLRERLRVLQWVAIGIGFLAVLVISIGYGQVPWLSIVVAGSFGTYGLIKSKIGGKVGALEGLTAETLVLFPLAAGFLVWTMLAGTSHFTTGGAGQVLIMLGLGPITAVPLLLFSAATRRVPLSWVGMMQYLTPTIQFILGVTLLDEQMTPARWIGFLIIWTAVLVLTVDMILASRKRPPRVVAD